MSDIKHSPLPWVSTDVHLKNDNITASNGFKVLGRYVNTKKSDSDFIVRACNRHYELIEALEMIISRSKDNKPGTSKVLDMQAIAMVALAKAKGESND